MIARQRLARLELHHVPAAVLAAVMVAREQERVRDLPAEAPRDVNELREANDRRPRQREALGADNAIRIGLDDLSLAVDDQTQSAPHGHHRERLERSV